MGFDADDYDFGGCGRGEVLGDLGDPHREGGLVGVFHGVGDAEFGAGFAEAGAVLRCCVDGDIEDGGGFYHFLGGEDAGEGDGG